MSSRHVFGRNHLVRGGNRLYYLKWQWKSTSQVTDLIYLTIDQYQAIKKMLLEVKNEQVIPLSDKSNAVVYTHKTNAKTYMRIKHYVFKHILYESYLQQWAHNHQGPAFQGMKPASYKEWLNNETTIKEE